MLFEDNVTHVGYSFANSYAACYLKPCGPYVFRGNVGQHSYSSCPSNMSGTHGYTHVSERNVWISDGGGGTSLCYGNIGDRLLPAGTSLDAAVQARAAG
jgi:hypothetical protein